MIEFELLPTANTRQQLNAEQIGEREHVGRLTMRVRVQLVRAHILQRVMQDVENVGRLVDTAADESAKQRDVVVRDMAVRDAACLSVAKVMCRQQVVFESLEVSTISRGRYAGAPQLGELKLCIQILQIRRACAKVRNIDMPPIDEAQLLCGDGTTKMARSLSGSQATAIGESRDQVALAHVLDCRAERPGQSKVPKPVHPL